MEKFKLAPYTVLIHVGVFLFFFFKVLFATIFCRVQRWKIFFVRKKLFLTSMQNAP